MASNVSTAIVLPLCSIVWRMVRTKMSPERPVLGTMSATSAFFHGRFAGAQRGHDLDLGGRRPCARGIGIGGRTMPLLGCPSGPSSPWRIVSPKNTVNQCGGNASPRLMLSGSTSKVAATRRTAIMPISSSTVRTRPIQGADPSSLCPSSRSSRLVLMSVRAGESHACRQTERACFRRPFHQSKDRTIRSSSTSCTRPAPAGVPSCRPLPT